MPWRPMLLNAGPQTFPALQRKNAKGILLVLQSAYLAFYHRMFYLLDKSMGWVGVSLNQKFYYEKKHPHLETSSP